MKTLSLIIILLTFSLISMAYEIICPKVPLTAISIEITPKVTFNKKTNLYKYEYTFKNHSSSKLPILFIRMQTYQNVLNSKATAKYWSLRYEKLFDGISWSPVPVTDSEIKPGTSLSGFEFESPNPPGLIKYTVHGWKDIFIKENQTRIVFAAGEAQQYAEDEIESDCPGTDFPERLPEIVGITIGPVPSDTVVAKIRLKRLKDKKWQGSPEDKDEKNDKLELSPLDIGKIQLLLFDDKDIDVSKIDLKSIQFGPGKAVPVFTKFIQYVDDEKDSEIVEHLKKHNKSHLLMEFNIPDLKVECNLDKALFMTAKMGDKKLSGAVKIKPAFCSEVHKIKTERAKKEKKPKKVLTEDEEIYGTE